MSKVTNTAKANLDGLLLEAMIGGSDFAIGRQEARGQAELVNSCQLPTDCNIASRKVLEAWGVKLGEPCADDPIFCPAELPAGWKKERTDHAMWSNLVDEKGRVRAQIFYKAAFYDRSAHMYTVPRFATEADYSQKVPNVGLVKDGGKTVIHRTDPISIEGLQSYEIGGKARDAAAAWLDARFPDWKNPLAYWDVEVEASNG